jgi:hypothetical protein
MIALPRFHDDRVAHWPIVLGVIAAFVSILGTVTQRWPDPGEGC